MRVKNWSVALKEELRLRCARRERWGRYLHLKGCKEQETEVNCIVLFYMICALHHILLDPSNQRTCDGRDVWHAWIRRELHTTFLCGKPEGKRSLWRVYVDGKIILK